MGAAKAGIPTVVIVGTTFVKTASLVTSWAGMPDLGIAEYPGAIKLHTAEEMRENLENGVLQRIVDGLTGQPGKAPMASYVNDRHEVVFSGTLEEVNDYFRDKGWTDRLPIFPPTAEKVEQFLKHTDSFPDEEIAVLPQANLRATPRNVAVNAVMAGCPPEFMPLLITAVEAVADPDFQLMSLGSTGCKIPWLLINGPIVKQLGIEYGVGARSLGPNPVIARAFELVIRNVAGFRPGETAMGTWGYPNGFVLAEDEDACNAIGWKPYHVEHGFAADASTVTVRGTTYWGDQARPASADIKSLLQVVRKHHERMVPTEISLPFGEHIMVGALITPPTAKALARAGYSKRDFATYLWQHTRVTAHEADRMLQGFTGKGRVVHDLVREGTLPKWFDVGPDETIPVLPSPDLIDPIVCGDAYKDKVMSLWCNYFKPVTKEIKR